jgi:hypothetical protein
LNREQLNGRILVLANGQRVGKIEARKPIKLPSREVYGMAENMSSPRGNQPKIRTDEF